MSIETDIDAVLKMSNLQAYYKAAPQYAQAPFTVFRRVESDPLQTLSGPSGWRRSDFSFESWAPTQLAAGAQRDAVAAAIVDNATSLPTAFELPSGESGFDPETNQHMEPCAFSFWHE